MDSFSWQIGNGRMAMFWMDIWCGNHPSKQEFTRLFRLARQKEGTLADFMRNYGLSGEEWNDLFTRSLLGREEVMLSKLVVRVSSAVLVLDVEDNFCWAHDRNEELSVRKCSELLIMDGGD
ncbi:hypothetical protein Goari_015084 [Gossypium aridum]|uniref:Uncharacterized protein n=1 Tax=Gossypium aridum TaxID=34290 RepID=A0A7J8XJS8_GOSAI|nr:hypothetical protein [Gossypium aridum]